MEKSASIYIDIDGSDNIPPYDQSPAERFAGMTREEIDAMIEEEEALIARSGGKWRRFSSKSPVGFWSSGKLADCCRVDAAWARWILVSTARHDSVVGVGSAGAESQNSPL